MYVENLRVYPKDYECKHQLQESGHVESTLRNLHDDEVLTSPNALLAAQDFPVILL
jgi:hypothetical protein